MTRSRALLLSVLAIALLGGGVFVVGLRGSATTGAPGGAHGARGAVDAPEDGAGTATTGAALDTRLAPRPDGHAPGETRTPDGQATTMPVRVTGRVVDDRRRPVPGARVIAHLLDAATSSGTSGADGRFELDTTLTRSRAWAFGTVRAVDGAGRAALAGVDHRPPSADVGTLELAPAFPITVRVLDEGRAVPDATLLLWTILDDSGLLRLGEGVTNGQGEANLPGFPSGTFLLLATGPNGRRARATVRIWDAAPETTVIELRPERTLDVIVRERKGSGIPGASIDLKARRDKEDYQSTVWYHPRPLIPLTDGAGVTTIRGLCEGEELVLSAHAEGFVSSSMERAQLEDGRAEIFLERTRTVSWPLVAGEAPIPASGTVVALRPRPGGSGSVVPPTARVEGSLLVVDGLSRDEVHAIATAPDGSIAEVHLANADAEPPDTAFVRPHRIHVTVTDSSGRGVPGIFLMPDWGGFGGAPGQWTDAEGEVTLKGLPPRVFTVNRHGSHWGSSRSIGDVLRLWDGDGRIAVRIGDEHDLELHFRVDGEARIPSGLECDLDDVRKLHVEEDPTRGILRMRVRAWSPSGTGSLEARAKELETRWVDFAWAKDGPTVVPIEFPRSGTIVSHVARKAGVAFRVYLEQYSIEFERWDVGNYTRVGDPLGPSVRYTALSPGEYRLRDMATGLFSDTLVVQAGGSLGDLSLDLSTAYEVSGRVVVPEGYYPRRLCVVAEGKNVDVATDEVGHPVQWEDDEWRFRCLVPGGRPIVLRAADPELVPDPAEGAVTLQRPRDDVVLKLVEGRRATFHAVAPPGMPLEFERQDQDSRFGDLGERTPMSALLLTGDAESKEVVSRALAGSPPDFRFAGYEPGTYTVFIDAPPFAPKTLRDVKLGEGKTDLGEIAFERGSTLTVRLPTNERKPATPGRITAWQNAAPEYFRTQGAGPDALRVRGLAAGHLTIQVSWTDATGQSRLFDSEVDVDGVADLVLDVDIR